MVARLALSAAAAVVGRCRAFGREGGSLSHSPSESLLLVDEEDEDDEEAKESAVVVEESSFCSS